MFTGLIEATGRIEQRDMTARSGRLRVRTPLAPELRTGDSIAVNGVCLTVAALTAGDFSADLSSETLTVTSLGSLQIGQTVNLERPVRADARMGGHFVLGHVDATGCIAAIEPDGDGYRLDVIAPDGVTPYLVPKGSVAVDGISLTIASLAGSRFTVQIVPYTFTHTALSHARAGDPVNLEADVLGKYVAHLLGRSPQGEPAGVHR